MTVYRRLLAHLRPYVWPRFVAAVVCMLLYSGTNGLMPYLVRSVFDDVFVHKREWALRVLPNQLYYSFFLPFAYARFFLAAQRTDDP